MADEPLLNLNTLIDRQTIDIDGTRFELFSADELSVLASHRFSVWGRRVEALAASQDEEAGAEYQELVDRIALNALVDMPAAIFETLSGAHKLAIVDVFTGLLLRNRLKAAGAMARAMGVPPTGATSFPGSSDITAERPGGGWLKRLLRWCGLI
ncbi:MAG: hypothetical protein HEQ22_03425 [Sphingopyxis sp.]|uniref:hypothetical protein n=1 Tax=Sphingopyxis sp. TaxID=1908224 RepID=UPI003D80F4E8